MKCLRLQHQSNGFALMEVAIAIAIMGIMLTPILILQNNLFRRVNFNKQKIERLLSLKKVLSVVLIKPLQEGETSRAQQLNNSEMEVVYEQQPVTGSVLSRFKGLILKKAVGTWREWDGSQQEKLAELMFIPERPEEKKE